MSVNNDALHAARKNDRRRRKAEDDHNHSVQQKHTGDVAALRKRWEEAAAQFLDQASRQDYAGATVVQLHRNHFWQPKRSYAAWHVWTKDFGYDSRTPSAYYYLLADGRMAFGSLRSVSIVGSERTWEYAYGLSDLQAIVSSLEKMAASQPRERRA